MDSYHQFNDLVRHRHRQRAVYMFMANRRKDIAGIYFATRHVVIADWIFTTPSVIVQLITGIALVHVIGYELFKGWALILYFFAGACWLSVVWMQIKMRDMAKDALDKGAELPVSYWKMDRWWIILGSLAFPAIVMVFGLMVYRPGF